MIDFTGCAISNVSATESEYLRRFSTAPHGTIFHHISLKNKDGTPVRCRVTGKCKLWKTRPADFRLPVKYGLYNSFYITPTNASDWR